MRDGDTRCILCRGARGWWPCAQRRCEFHPGIAAQHHVCCGCAEAYGLGEQGFFDVCPEAPEIAVVRALMGEAP